MASERLTRTLHGNEWRDLVLMWVKLETRGVRAFDRMCADHERSFKALKRVGGMLVAYRQAKSVLRRAIQLRVRYEDRRNRRLIARNIVAAAIRRKERLLVR